MTTIGNILDPAARRQLEQLGKPEDDRDLATEAREAATESAGLAAQRGSAAQPR